MLMSLSLKRYKWLFEEAPMLQIPLQRQCCPLSKFGDTLSHCKAAETVAAALSFEVIA